MRENYHLKQHLETKVYELIEILKPYLAEE